VQDGDETAVDCGGGACPPCGVGATCGAGSDCTTARCIGGVCADALVISEVQSRGSAGGNDEFVELYNPTASAVVVDATWTLLFRSIESGCSTTDELLFTGAGQSIPSHGHLLVAAAGGANPYDGAVAADATYGPPSSSLSLRDAGSVILKHGAAVADALCYYLPSQMPSVFAGCGGYTCEGTPVQNDHDASPGTNADLGLERAPGGASGSTQDTDDNATDFAATAASDPEDLASTPVP
ncbi:MAG TPA: hypothetical protein VHB21_25190, partial [Minicystis sp.]|nr:hypothetical protein [Minicystis sp.]